MDAPSQPHTTTDVDICRANGWTVGDRLVGDEGYGPTVIRITAIGEQRILAIAESHNGVPAQAPSEGVWTLAHRSWQPAPDTP